MKTAITRKEGVGDIRYTSRERRGFPERRLKGVKDDEARRVYTERERRAEKGAKEKDIRVRKNESIRADVEGPSTADKRDS